MPLKIGAEIIGGLRIGREDVGGMKIGTEMIYQVGQPVAPYHSYTITVGQRSGITGYWFNNIGNITDATYNLPNTISAIIRQSMILGEEFRFLISSGGVTVSSLDQFPTRIVCTRAGRSVVFVRADPVQIASFGQGIGMDYVVGTGAISGIFNLNTTVAIQLFY